MNVVTHMMSSHKKKCGTSTSNAHSAVKLPATQKMNNSLQGEDSAEARPLDVNASVTSVDFISSTITSSVKKGPNRVDTVVPSATGKEISKEIVLRSCELEPSLHQMEIPICSDVLLYSRIVLLAETYRKVDQNFDFGALVGLSRLEMDEFCDGRATSTGPTAMTRNASSFSSLDVGTANETRLPRPSPFKSSSMRNIRKGATPRGAGERGLVPAHRRIINSILECEEEIILKHFFTFGPPEENERVEVAFFCCQRNRQFIVSYRGTTDQQKKPIRKHISQKDEGCEGSILDENEPVPIHPNFKTSYFAQNMESKVFEALNELARDFPFFDVVMTGHSHGAALATIGGVRYALRYPMMRVSVVVYGCPRIGGIEFRVLANSLPNLKIIRIEHGEDHWVAMPEGPKWSHAGHSIVLSPSLFSISSTSTEAKSLSSKSASPPRRLSKALSSKQLSSKSFSPKSSSAFDQKLECSDLVLAYRFDENHPNISGRNFGHGFMMNLAKIGPSKNDIGIISYVHAMEMLTYLGSSWVTSFVGVDGHGVVGENLENRHVV